MPFLLVFSTADLLDARVRRRSHGDRHHRWSACTYSFKFAWAPLVDRVPLPVLDALARPPAQLDAAGAGRHLVLGCSPWRSAIRAADLWWLRLSPSSSPSSRRPRTSRSTPTASRPDETLTGRHCATYQLGYQRSPLAGSSMPMALLAAPWHPALVGRDHAVIAEPDRWPRHRRATSQSPRSRNAGLPPALRSSEGCGSRKPSSRRSSSSSPIAAGCVMLLFVACSYKYGDALGGTMAKPFYIDMGFILPEIAGITKSFGFVMTILGATAGRRAGAPHRRCRACWRRGILMPSPISFSRGWPRSARHVGADRRDQRRQSGDRRAGRRRCSSPSCRASAPPAWRHAICAAHLDDGLRPVIELSGGRRLDWRATDRLATFWMLHHVRGCAIPGTAVAGLLAMAPAQKETPPSRAEGGVVVNRLRGINRAGGTGPFRSGAWGARRNEQVPCSGARYKTVTGGVENSPLAWRRARSRRRGRCGSGRRRVSPFSAMRRRRICTSTVRAST